MFTTHPRKVTREGREILFSRSPFSVKILLRHSSGDKAKVIANVRLMIHGVPGTFL